MSEELKKGHVEIMELGDEVNNLYGDEDGKSSNIAVRKSVCQYDPLVV